MYRKTFEGKCFVVSIVNVMTNVTRHEKTELMYTKYTYSYYGTYLLKIVKIYAKQKHLGFKKCRANQKQHCKQAGATKRFDIS